MEPLELIGPLGIRRFHLAKVCQTHVGHEHNYDHDTIVIRGPLQVLFTDVATGGDVDPAIDADAIVTTTSRRYDTGDVIFIAAHRRHTIKALAPDVHYLCVYSHRDFDGIVSQEYVGNPDAYGHDRVIEPTPKVVSQLSLSR